MNIKLSILLNEIQAAPPVKQHPELRSFGAQIVYYIRKAGRDAVKRWEISNDGKVRLYFGVIHYDPKKTQIMQPLWRIIGIAEKFNVPFRMFGDGNMICMEIESKMTYETKTI
jgi:hypothetical protein